jgi:LPS O-antigen subunit length determinant protein (WzzB/FepE family)
MPQSNQTQDFNSHEEEISLLDLLEIIIRRKVFILATTSICTLLSIFYVMSIAPSYRASISFMEPQETFHALLPLNIAKHLPNLPAQGQNNQLGKKLPTAFTMFLSKVTSYSFKKIVFENNNFLEKFTGKNNADRLENVVLGIHNSISISKEKVSADLPEFERPVSLKMTGSQPKLMSEFLNTLVDSAKQATIQEIINMTSLIVNNEISEISREINILRSVSEEQKNKQRNSFSTALVMAKNLGIKNNNFDKLKSSNVAVGITSKGRTSLNLSSAELGGFLDSQEQTTINVEDTTLPVWYLYGEKALQQELDMLKRRGNEMSIAGMSLKNISLKTYKNINPSALKIKVVTISQPSIPPSTRINRSNTKIVAIAMVLGLGIGIFMAFIRKAMDLLNKKQLSTTSKYD